MSDSSTLAIRVVARPQLDIRAAGKTGIRITMQPQGSKDTFPYTPALVERDYPKAVISLRELDSGIRTGQGTSGPDERDRTEQAVVGEGGRVGQRTPAADHVYSRWHDVLCFG